MSDEYDLRPIDTDESRYENSKREWEIIPELSSPNTDFGGPDPAMDDRLEKRRSDEIKTPAERATMLPPEELEARANENWGGA